MKTKKIIAKIGLLAMILYTIYIAIYTPIVDLFPSLGYWVIPVVILAWIVWIILVLVVIFVVNWIMKTLQDE